MFFLGVIPEIFLFAAIHNVRVPRAIWQAIDMGTRPRTHATILRRVLRGRAWATRVPINIPTTKATAMTLPAMTSIWPTERFPTVAVMAMTNTVVCEIPIA